jgi:hypothetical protein
LQRILDTAQVITALTTDAPEVTVDVASRLRAMW